MPGLLLDPSARLCSTLAHVLTIGDVARAVCEYADSEWRETAPGFEYQRALAALWSAADDVRDALMGGERVERATLDTGYAAMRHVAQQARALAASGVGGARLGMRLLTLATAADRVACFH
jgi:hypothetical protein